MTILLNSAFEEIRKKEVAYQVQKECATAAATHAKENTKLIMGNPSTLGAFFAAGAYKGASSSSPKHQRKRAIFAFMRTALTSILQ
jgi:hypothetical protein